MSVKAYADDIGIRLLQLAKSLPILARCFKTFRIISGLALKSPKYVIIPLWMANDETVRDIIASAVPEWIDIKVSTSGKYLGFMLETATKDLSWTAPAIKWEKRAGEVRACGLGTVTTIELYNSKAVSCLTYVAQLTWRPASALYTQACRLCTPEGDALSKVHLHDSLLTIAAGHRSSHGADLY